MKWLLSSEEGKLRLQRKPKKNKFDQPVFGTSNSLEAQVNFLFAIQNDMAEIWKPDFTKQDPLMENANGLDTVVANLLSK